mmetsp:Transcript_16806/g.27331  ORF Transcript_16806/g.27331 Transcript_16806/m.27331 type:complete len:107 (+) Transcript_16806:228-548(+)
MIIAVQNTSKSEAAAIVISTQQHKPLTKSRRRPKLGIQGTYDRSETSFGMVMMNRIQWYHCQPQRSTFHRNLAINPTGERVSLSIMPSKLDPETPIEIETTGHKSK